ncbi:Inner membrane protein YihY, formerly thought to be RNase BN [Lunatimonas lonarensis]|uniref:Inner membrane protein YihY, formerly thought to be RNase BN n=1 Tax=Lunatimonas lonarensis TaxID=1232681 RepID=R7ZSS5_9BACT|nr:YihY/virulence factor BrkB family protein [Lunatimonas lonarensis]EON77083.1 Inner membrane protein YihY, formerly thought to be RNase BN [Lunatimonas lonarensis]
MIKRKLRQLRKLTFFQILKDSIKDFGSNDSMTFAASTAFYTIFSLPALLIIVLHIASTFYSKTEVREELLVQMGNLIGEESVQTLDQIMQNVTIDNQIFWSQLLGIAILVFSATTVFVSLQNSINHIWHIKPKPERGLVKFIVNRMLSFSMVASIGFLLLVSLVLDAIIVVVFNYFSDLVEGNILFFARIANFVLAQALMVLIFGLMYKILPDAKVRWRDVWLGAMVTMALFALGKYLIGVYLGNAEVGSYYGTAGSLVVILVWVYYSVVIFLFGAQITYYIAENVGGSVIPLAQAVKVELVELDDSGKIVKGEN